MECISNACDPENWHRYDIYEKLARAPGVFLTFGCHPSKAPRYTMEQRKQLKVFLDAAATCDGIEGNFLEKEKVIGESIKAVGECGLDSTYYDKGSPRASQVCCHLIDSIST